MSKKMKNAPVYFTIIQVRFNSIQKMDAFAPNIQEKFRKTEFPDAQTTVLNTLNLNFGNPSEVAQAQMPNRQLTQHTYSNFERNACFVLDSSSLTFQTTEYDRFETFSATFLLGLKIIDEEVGGINFVDRLGLRYLDAFKAAESDDITNYLNKSVIGLFGFSGARVSHSFTETVYSKEKINVTARVIILDGQFGFPMDIQPGSLTVGDRFKAISGVHAMLDIDCSITSREKFDLEKISGSFGKIHVEVDTSFKEVATDHARKVWG